MAIKPYGVRLIVDNGEKFKRDFDDAGQAGETAMKRIAEASRRAEGDLKMFQDEVDEVGDSLDGADKKGSALGATLGKLIGGAVAGAIAGFVALAYGAKNAAASISEIGDAADRAGVDADFYERIGAGLTQIGQASTNLEDQFRTLGKRIGDERAGIARGARSFDALGVSVTKANGAAKSTEEIFFDLADAFERTGDKAVKSAAAQELFSETGTELIPFLEKGANGIRELGDEAERLGLLYGGELIRSAQEINTEFAVQAQIIEVQLKSALILAAPLIRDLTNEFIEQLPAIINATHALLAFLGVIEKPIKLQLQDVEEHFETLNTNRVQAIEGLRERLGKIPGQEGFEDALAQGSKYDRFVVAQIDNINKGLDEALEKKFALEDKLAQLNAPAATIPAAEFIPVGGGGGAAKEGPFAKAVEAAEKQIAALRFENETRDLNADAIARQRLELALLTAAEEEFGGKVSPAVRAEIDRLTAALGEQTAAKEKNRQATEAMKKAEKEAAAAARQLTQDFKSTVDSIIGNLEDVINKTKSWEQALFSVIKAILASKSAQDGLGSFFDGLFNGGAQSTTAGAGAQIGGWFGFGASPAPSARGNAFDPGGTVVPFRFGGVVEDRTRFGFAGGIGEMSENGPEAIAPLGRNARGELGIKIVEAAGPGRAEAPMINIFTSDPDTRVTFGPSRAQGARRVRSFQARAVS